MDLYEVIDHVASLLQQRGRLTYRTLKLQFQLDEEQLAALKEELIEGQRIASDENGKVLVWVGAGASSVSRTTSQVLDAQSRSPLSPSPANYTPKHLAERILAEQAAMEMRGITEGERKTITALFADIKGSTALIEGLDPEEARAIIDPALQLMMDAVHRYEGYVAQALGDGIFALFGAPIAHEDHPQRALYAALRMQEEMRRYADKLRLTGGPPLQMRVGVNTGEVVVRSIRKDDLQTDYVPVGHSINLAARMEQMATPGSILITEHTRKLTEGYFDLKALGAAAIKGLDAPLPVYEVVGAGPLRTKLQVAARRGLTRFVGRHSELEQLRRALDHAQAGHGQIVGVMGEPGLGKSRLFYEFKLISHSGGLVLEAYSVSHGKASPYLPVIELLKQYFQLTPHDDERQRKEKIAGKVLILDRSLEDTLPYLFALLGIEDLTSSLQQMDPQIRRRRTFEAIKKLFLRESLNQPLILIFEDLHWIDTETQGLLDTFSESVASARVLLLTTYRPEYRHDWGQKTYYTQLRLAPLGTAEAEELLIFLLGTDASLTALQRQILLKTEGTPFFMEEVVQTLAEEGVLVGERGAYRLAKVPAVLHISPTVQGVLAARIDRLAPEEKALLQQLAVIGREFPLSLVRQSVTQSEDVLYRLLASLQHKEFLYEQPAFPEVEYIFKHALTQEVAYNSVLQDRRKALHEQTAHAIEGLYHASLEEHYSALAHHYSRSGNTEKAIEYLQHAGQQAAQRSANAEAISHLTAALALLRTLPDTRERAQRELLLQVALGPVLIVTKGYAASEVESVYLRARDLCQQLGETAQLFTALWGLSACYVTQAKFPLARELAGQFLTLARSQQELTVSLEAYRLLGFTLVWAGECGEARTCLEQGIALYHPQHHQALISQYGEDAGVCCLAFVSQALWTLGYPDQAAKRIQDALSLAQEVAHPYSLAHALLWAAYLHQFRREARAAHERAQETITLSAAQGFPLLEALGQMLQGGALVEQGQQEEGIAHIRQGQTSCQVLGAGIMRPYHLVVLAEAYGKGGRAQEGLAVLAEALAIGYETGEGFYEAEVYRLKGELTLKQSNVQSPGPQVEAEAEACFHKAVDIARRQSAKSLELRAVMSLAHLWQSQGKQKEAHDLLSEVYNWFTEGFDTKDLQEAKALLETLA